MEQREEEWPLPQREAVDPGEVHPLPQLNKRVGHALLSRDRPCVEALDSGHHHFGDDLLLALLAQQVGHHAGDALRERHALHLLVLHVAAQHERHDVFIEAHRLRHWGHDVATVLADRKRALRVKVRQAGVHFG
eukprot:scaffold2842_cov60-Phaeocystis_antarctica.AAC.2